MTSTNDLLYNLIRSTLPDAATAHPDITSDNSDRRDIAAINIAGTLTHAITDNFSLVLLKGGCQPDPAAGQVWRNNTSGRTVVIDALVTADGQPLRAGFVPYVRWVCTSDDTRPHTGISRVENWAARYTHLTDCPEEAWVDDLN